MPNTQMARTVSHIGRLRSGGDDGPPRPTLTRTFPSVSPPEEVPIRAARSPAVRSVDMRAPNRILSVSSGRFEALLGARVRPIVSVGVACWSGSGSDFAEEPVCRNESRPRWQ